MSSFQKGNFLSTSPSSLLLASSLFLVGLGCVMIYSTTAHLSFSSSVPPHLSRHGLGIVFGLFAGLALAYLPIRTLKVLIPLLFAVGIIALGAVLLIGIKVNGAQRWLHLPGLGVVQPGELAKLSTVLFVSYITTRQGDNQGMTRRQALLSLTVGALPIGLLVLQPDFGNAVLLGILVVTLLFSSGAPLRWLLLPGAIGATFAVIFISLNQYALDRLTGFLDPWGQARDQGFQLIQSFIAFSRGGPFGVGLGYGRQKLHYLPEAHTDFILSVVAEELGLLGVLAVLLAFSMILIAGVKVALSCRDRFTSLLAFGLTLLVVVPALVNAAVVMGALPTKGLSLPFLSYGRSSLIASCGAIGLVWGLARRTEKDSRDFSRQSTIQQQSWHSR